MASRSFHPVLHALMLFAVVSAGFVIMVHFRSIDLPDNLNATRNLGYQSGGLFLLDATDVTDPWTGNRGVESTLIGLAQQDLYLQAINEGISISEGDVDSFITERLVKSNTSMAQWLVQLNESEVSLPEARHKVRKILLANAMVHKRVAQSVNVSHEEIQEFFTKNRVRFTSSDPQTSGRLPELGEVRDIINSTITKRKIKEGGQRYIDGILAAMVDSSVERSNLTPHNASNRTYAGNGSVGNRSGLAKNQSSFPGVQSNSSRFNRSGDRT